MNPNWRASRLAMPMVSRLEAVRFQTGSTPAINVPMTLPRAPTPKAMGTETTAVVMQAIALAARTRPRPGTRVNVVSALRWLHSSVTDKIAMIGRTIVVGMPIADANEL